MKNKIYLVTLSPNTHRTSEENLGILYLKSSLVKAGYQVEIIDGWLNEYSVLDVFNKIVYDENLLFVGISSYMSNTKPSIELVQLLKRAYPDIKIVGGGFGPTFYPNDHLDNGYDFICRGEGEISLVELADCLKRGSSYKEIKGISYKDNDIIINNPCHNLVDDLDSLPFPARDTMDIILKNKSTVNMLTSRGCSGNCEFCSVISFFRLSDGRIWRTRSINNIVDEIENLYQQGVTYIKMVDDSFVDGIRDVQWCHDFANEINKRNIKVNLRGQIRADKITDEILFYLKEAGFFSFACGIENGSETSLARMNKKATLEDNRRALELFKKYQYLVQMGFILFDRETTLEELEENYRFLREFEYTVTKGIFSEMYSAEGTFLNSKLRKNNQLSESDFIHNNNKYQLVVPEVKLIYDALKLWHKSHSEVYDMTIDPLTAPKALPREELQLFYDYAMELKRKDLEIFESILDLSRKKTNDINTFVLDSIANSSSFYDSIEQCVAKVYQKNGFNYNASKNPFI